MRSGRCAVEANRLPVRERWPHARVPLNLRMTGDDKMAPQLTSANIEQRKRPVISPNAHRGIPFEQGCNSICVK